MKNKYLILWCKQGQLANRIIVFTHTLAFARENGYKIINLSFYDYAHYFPQLNKDFLCRFPITRFSIQLPLLIRKIIYRAIYFIGSKAGNFGNKYLLSLNYANENEVKLLTDPSIYELIKGSKFVFLNGWLLRDYNSVNKHKNIIKDIFYPAGSITSRVTSFIEELRKSNSVLIGVHIRRGDYSEFQGGRYFYNLLTYKSVMTSLIEYLGKHILFLICSNEKVDKDIFSDFNIVMGIGTAIEDLYSLSECDYIIGPPSTYSLWASFYGNKPLYQITNTSNKITLKDFFISQC